ncbi:zinc finger protein 518A [Callorhinchus milii]|uniref:zinc finger protein 518A n=1 Tax=Callorhinchus milii TaxID=7868 RepID=UPI0004573888|nr:zinc finger protein 518A [Callorhinchus milii]XP_007894608.1 zinc finger protein 518A [Callorhinchus milii]XP_007894618.1 zinc finger protein 518A [Callorhinchus milii]|eukprot:gi/632936366/ref/XP_007894597.1/ PREDICTED: zinc finger protein 518A [Callorhinchus milii]
MQTGEKISAQSDEANASFPMNSKSYCGKINVSKGSFLRRSEVSVGDKFTKVTFTPVSVNVSKDSQQKLKLKLENSKVVLSKLNMERDLFQNSLVSLNKKSSRRCQTARKSFRKELSCFKKGSVPQALGAMSKTSPEAAKNVLIKVLRFSCAKCKDNVEYNPKQLQKHYQELHAADLPVYPCELCTFTANDFQSLRQHRLQHRTPLLNCEVCNDGKMYTLQELRRHLNWKHCVNGHFRCEKCRFSTKDQGTFIQHIHRHDEIQYKCGKCEHVSYTKGEFQRHLVVHTGSFPFSCQYCSYGATRKDYIVKHLNAVHKELTENSNLKADLDSSQKGKGKNPVGLKLVLKRYNNGVSRKTQWRKKGLHAVATMDNAKRYFDTTNKCNSVRPQSPTTVDPILSDGILNTKDVGFENVGNRGQNPKVSTSFPQSKTASSSQISKNFHPGASVVMVNNKLSVPPNYSAQFMGFKVVDGKQHLVIKLVPATKQNSTLSNSPPQALSDSSTNLLQSSADTVEQIHLQKKDCNGLTGTNTLSVGSSMDLPSVKFDITANQPQVSTSINSSVILKTLSPVLHKVPDDISVTIQNDKVIQLPEPLLVGMNTVQRDIKQLPAIPISSPNLIETIINKTLLEKQLVQNKNPIENKTPTLDQCPGSSGHLPNTFAYLTKSQIDSSTDLQYVMGRQTSSEEKMACSDFHTSLQSSEKGTDLPLLHEYAKRSTSEHNCHYALLVKGDIPNTSVNSQPSTVAFQQRTELRSAEPPAVEAGRNNVSSSQQLQGIITTPFSKIPKLSLLNRKIYTPSMVSISRNQSVSYPSQPVFAFQNCGSQGLSEFSSPLLLQMLKPSEENYEGSDEAKMRMATTKTMPVSSASTSLNCTAPVSTFVSTNLVSVNCDESTNNNGINNINSETKSVILSEQSNLCLINEKEQQSECLDNLNHPYSVEASESGKADSKLEAQTLPMDNTCDILNNESSALQKQESEFRSFDWSSHLTGVSYVNDENDRSQNASSSETMNGDSTAECSNKLDYSGADSSSEKELQHDATGYEWAEMKDHNTRGYINEEMHHVDADNNFQVDAQMSPEMPRITSVFSLQTGHEMNCLPPEENQLILDALTNTSVFLGHENVCSESRILERQTGVNIPAHKTLLHSFSSKEDTPVVQQDCTNIKEYANSTVLSKSKCIDDGNKLQSISLHPASSISTPASVEQLNTLLKTHGDEIINKQLMKDAIRTSANGNNRSSVVPVTLLRPIRLAGLNKPILIQSLQKGSAVPSHLSKQSRLQLVSGGSVSELNTAVLQTVTDNSISQTKKRPGMILTFSKGTLGAVSNLVCGGNLQTPKVKRETPSSGSCVGQNTHSVVTSGSEISCAKSSSVPAVNSMPFKSTLFFKGPISALVDHCSYAKDTTASKETLENSIEKRSLEGCVDDADLLFQPCENVKSFVSSNSSSHSMSQERVLGCSSTPRNIKAETLPSQQTVVLQCLMQKKQTGPSSEDSPVNTSSTSDDTGPPQKKILLRIVKRSNEESSTKDGQYLKNALSTFQKDAAGNLIKPLQQPSPAVLLTTGGSHCFLLPVNKHFPSSAATWRFLPQGGVHTSLKLPIPRIPRTPSIRSTEKSTGKVYSFNTPKSATKSNCRSTKEKSDEVWTPRKASNEKLVFRYSKRLKRKLEHSEKSLKTVTIDYGTHKEKQKGELNKRVEFHNSAATARTVRTMRLIPFDHHQLIRCPRRNQPVIVLNHPDVDVPEVYNVMKTMKKYQGNVIKVVLSKRTIEALLNPTSSNVRVAAKGFPAIRHKKVKPVSPVKERYILKLKLKKTSKNNYQIVKTVSSKAIEAKFSCWFCGRIFDNQDDWVGHGQRHLMEATRDWNTLI